jgi:hypothetical protein
MATPLTVRIQQRPSDRQWTIRVTSTRNKKQVAWSGEFYKRRAHAIRMADKLFGGIHGAPVIEPAARA